VFKKRLIAIAALGCLGFAGFGAFAWRAGHRSGGVAGCGGFAPLRARDRGPLFSASPDY